MSCSYFQQTQFATSPVDICQALNHCDASQKNGKPGLMARLVVVIARSIFLAVNAIYQSMPDAKWFPIVCDQCPEVAKLLSEYITTNEVLIQVFSRFNRYILIRNRKMVVVMHVHPGCIF